jgi:hypothetical protein
MNQWILVDARRALEEGEDHPKMVIQSEEQLQDELNQQAAKTPGVIGLISPDEDSVDVGIGGPFAAIGWYPPPSQSRYVGYKIGLADQLYSPAPVQFVSEGIPIPSDPGELFPVQHIIEAVLYFYRNHRLPDWITWREWNPVTLSWETHPANGSRRPVPVQTAAPE